MVNYVRCRTSALTSLKLFRLRRTRNRKCANTREYWITIRLGIDRSINRDSSREPDMNIESQLLSARRLFNPLSLSLSLSLSLCCTLRRMVRDRGIPRLRLAVVNKMDAGSGGADRALP